MEAINQQATKVMDTLIAEVDEIGDHKKIDNTKGAFMPVVIECIGRCNYGLLYSIAHYYKQNGDLVCDPDMVFIKTVSLTKTYYYPVSFEQGGVVLKTGIFIENGTVTRFWEKEQRDQTRFANTWMKNIKEQQGLVI